MSVLQAEKMCLLFLIAKGYFNFFSHKVEKQQGGRKYPLDRCIFLYKQQQ